MTAPATTTQKEVVLFSRNLELTEWVNVEFQAKQSDPTKPIINAWRYGDSAEGHDISVREFVNDWGSESKLRGVWKQYEEWLDLNYPLCCECGGGTGQRIMMAGSELCDSCLDYNRFVK